jgi:hypothetical protein
MLSNLIDTGGGLPTHLLYPRVFLVTVMVESGVDVGDLKDSIADALKWKDHVGEVEVEEWYKETR